MKLKPEQEAHIELIAVAASRRREARATAKERARRMVEAELMSFDIEVQKLCARGEHMGIPYNQMAKRGLGTENGSTARREAEAGRQYVDFDIEKVIEESKPIQRYAYDPATKTLTVTFPPEDFAGKIDGITEPQSLAFTVDGIQIIPADDQWNHPAARLVLSDAGRKEALAFIESLNN